MSPRRPEETLRILLVDDDEVDRRAVRRALAAAGMPAHLQEAVNASEAAEHLASGEPYDCALVDYRLPDGDGTEVLRAARAGRGVPVVVLTGQGDEELAVEVMKAGASDYLAKSSLSPERLAHSLRHAIRVHRAERQAREAEKALREEAELVETLHRFGAELTSELDLHHVLELVTDKATSMTGAELGAFVPNPAAPFEAPLAETTSGPGVWDRLPIPGTSRLLTSTFEGNAVVRSDDLLDDEPDASPEGPRSFLAVPVVSRSGSVLGGLFFVHRRPDAFGSRQERIALGVSTWAAVAIGNARLYSEAQRAARARDEVLAVVSHDLRDPLQVVAMACSTLHLAAADETFGPVHKQLEVINRSARRMTRLIDDLLDVVRIEAGRLSVEPRREQVEEILREARETLAPVAREKGIRLEVDCRQPLPPVEADRERVLQVLSNLVGNAVRFSPEGSTITLSAGSHGDQVRLAVADQGRGIPSAEIPRLFDRFWQGGRGEGSGAGLGLAIVKGIVEAHGGMVEVRSREGEGSTFAFTLHGAAARVTA